MEFKAILNIMARRWRMGALIFGVIMAVGVGGALLITPWFESSAKVAITRPRAAAALLNTFSLSTYNQENTVADEERDSLIALAQVGPVLDDVSMQLKLEKERIRYRLLFAIPGLRATLKFLGVEVKSNRRMTSKDLTDSSSLRYLLPCPNIQVSQFNSTNILEIVASHTDRDMARQMADMAAKKFLEVEFERARHDYADLSRFVDKNLENARKQNQKDLEERRKYQLKDKTINLDSEMTYLISRMADAKKSMEELRTSVFRSKAIAASLEAQIPRVPEFQKAKEDILRTSDSVSTLKAKLADQFVSLMEAQGKYAKGHPELETAQTRVREIQTLLKEEMAKNINLDSAYTTLRTTLLQTYSELAGLEAQEKAWPIVLSRYEKDLLSYPDKIARGALLDLNVKASQNVYQLYLEYSQKIKLATQVDIRSLAVVETARATPEDESKPKMTTVTAITLALAVFFSLGSIFFLEFVDTSVHSVEDLDPQGQYPYLGLVPAAPATPDGLVAVSQPNSPANEAVRSARHALRLAQGPDSTPHMVLTSPSGEEGKNFLAANLAVALAREGSKVLLIDGDLRDPRLHKFFGVDNGRGWGSGLGQASAWPDLVRSTQIPGLGLLPAGPTPDNIGGLVEAPGLAQCLAQAGQSYDLVLMVGPPLLKSSDSLIFGEHLQGVVLVVQACKTGKQETAQALSLLQSARLNLLGISLTI